MKNNYESYEKAVYELKKLYKEIIYRGPICKKKIDYNFITAYWYVKDNILYKLEPKKSKCRNEHRNTQSKWKL